MNDKQELPHGQVIVERHGDGWYLVQIGRARYTKRFNLSAAEAAQIVEQLIRHGVAQGAPSAL